VLLHLNNVYELPNFEEQQSSALIALSVRCPGLMAPYLTGQFYTPHITMRARMLILNVVNATAAQLSSCHTSSPPVPEVITPLGLSNDGKTRRWSMASTRPQEASAPNAFGAHAGYYFYPLMAQFDTQEGTLLMLGQDSIVLGQLLSTLGILVEAAGNTTGQPLMVRTLLEFLLALRFHTHQYIRQCMMFAFSRALLAVNPGMTGIGMLNDIIAELKLWLEELVAQDPSPVNRECASQCLKMVSAINPRPLLLL